MGNGSYYWSRDWWISRAANRKVSKVVSSELIIQKVNYNILHACAHSSVNEHCLIHIADLIF